MLRSPARIALVLLVLLVVAVGVALATPGPFHRFFFDENLLEVVPGQIWRSAQPSPHEMDEFISRLGLQTVLNLRGDGGESDWLEEQEAVTTARGVELHTVRLSAKTMPPAHLLRKIVEVLETAPRPLLFHCKGGVERSGLVGAVAVLLAGGTLEEARAEFAPSKGYIQLVSGSELPRVLDDYESWLAAEGIPHSRDRFRAWIATDYHPYFYRASIAPTGTLAKLASGRENTLRFRVTNRSLRPIPFRATRDHGVHLGATLHGSNGDESEALELRDGFIDLDLAPGASHEFELALPPLAPGSFTLEVDLVDEGLKWFGAMGSTPLSMPLEVTRGG
jgi:undecaprenyl-diphosphatase